MFTGYLGLKFTSDVNSKIDEITEIEGNIVWYSGLTDNNVRYNGYKTLRQMESLLNKQGKAPKRIEYEVYLNAYYKNTDNAVDKLSGKYYSLDKAMEEVGYEELTPNRNVYYAPTCKLPSNYLPKPTDADKYLNVLWYSPSSKLTDNYWQSLKLLSDCVYVDNVFYDNETNIVIFDNDWVIEGDGTSEYEATPSLWLTPRPYIKAPCCKLPENSNPFSPPQKPQLKTVRDYMVFLGENGLFGELEPAPLWSEAERDYHVITDGEFISLFEIGKTEELPLHPYNAGDDTAYNAFPPNNTVRVIYSDNVMVSGDGMWRYGTQPQKWMERYPIVEAPCCRLRK